MYSKVALANVSYSSPTGYNSASSLPAREAGKLGLELTLTRAGKGQAVNI